MKKKTKFLIVMFSNDEIVMNTLVPLISLIWSIFIFLLPIFNILYYIFLIIILNILIYLILRTLFKKVESYIKLIKPFNFLKCYLLFILFFTIFYSFSIVVKYLNEVSRAYPIYISLLTFYSILFFVLIYVFLKEIKLSEFEKYSDLSFGDLGKNIEKGYFYNFYTGTPAQYSIFFFIVREILPQLLLIFIALIGPIITTLGVISFFEKSTYLVRKTLIELSKLQKDNIDELIKH